MLRSFTVTLAVALFAIPGLAQSRPSRFLDPKRDIDEALTTFVHTLNGNNVYFQDVDTVAGAIDFGHFGGPQWSDAWVKYRGDSSLEVEKVELSEVTATSAKAHVSYYWKHLHPNFRSRTINEDLTLQFARPAHLYSAPRWQIVPPALQMPLSIPLEPVNLFADVDPPDEPILEKVAASMADPQKGWAKEFAEQSLAHLNQIGLSSYKLAQDYDRKIAFSSQFWVSALEPYTRVEGFEKIPATGEPYAMNGNLSGRALIWPGNFEGDIKDQVPHPEQVVMFYEGKDQTPVFRYAGYAAILFADGHAALVTPEEAKKLVWKP